MTNSNKKKTDRVGFILKPSTIAAAAAIAASLVTPLRAQTTSWIGTIGLHSIQKGIEAEISKGILTKGIIGEDTSSNSKGDLYYAIFWNQNGSLSLNNGNIADKQDKTVTLTGNLNLKYNLEEDKSTVATALNFFEPEWMDEGNNYGLHKFHFDGSVNITIENASIEVSNRDFARIIFSGNSPGQPLPGGAFRMLRRLQVSNG